MYYVGYTGCPFSRKIYLNKTSSYKKHIDKLNFDGIDFQTPMDQIGKIEKQNNLAINVLGYKKKKTTKLYRVSEQPGYIKRINLFFVFEETEEANKTHYSTIVDLNRLLSDQTKTQHRQHFCERCFHGYTIRKIFYNVISQYVKESVRGRYKSRCQKKVKTMY